MSRQIPLDQPLTDEDRAYLESRGRDDLIARLDQDYPTVPTSDDNLGTQGPQVQPADLASRQQAGLTPTLTPQTGQGAAEAGDNYDDAAAWSYDDLKGEVVERKEAGAEDAPALNSSREVLVAWLREDDARANDGA